MSVRVQSKVWEHSKAAGNALVVLLKIADNCDDAGTNAWPSLPSLARYCRCSVSTVKRSIKELVALGELEVVHKGGSRRPGSPYAPNLYRVMTERYQVDTSGRLNLAPPEVSPVNAGRVKSVPPDGSAVSRNSSIEPSGTAADASRTIAEANLRLARRALGIEADDTKSECFHKATADATPSRYDPVAGPPPAIAPEHRRQSSPPEADEAPN